MTTTTNGRSGTRCSRFYVAGVDREGLKQEKFNIFAQARNQHVVWKDREVDMLMETKYIIYIAVTSIWHGLAFLFFLM